jgi:hypothetical protein
MPSNNRKGIFLGRINPNNAGTAVVISRVRNDNPNQHARAYFWHTNTVEGYFSLLKRAVFGTFHHVSEAHLHRYTAEQDFKWNTRKISDMDRFTQSISGIVGKRLTYRRSNAAQVH